MRTYLTLNDDSAYHPSALVASIKRNVFDKRRMKPVLSNLREGSKVLEIGTGAGRQLEHLADISPCPIELYANDIAFDDRARSSLRAKNIRLLEGAIENIDVETEARFDAIIGIHVIEHVIDPKAVFRWMSEHLAPGGVLYLETPDTNAPARYIFKDNWGHDAFPEALPFVLAQDTRRARPKKRSRDRAPPGDDVGSRMEHEHP